MQKIENEGHIPENPKLVQLATLLDDGKPDLLKRLIELAKKQEKRKANQQGLTQSSRDSTQNNLPAPAPSVVPSASEAESTASPDKKLPNPSPAKQDGTSHAVWGWVIVFLVVACLAFWRIYAGYNSKTEGSHGNALAAVPVGTSGETTASTPEDLSSEDISTPDEILKIMINTLDDNPGQ